MDWQGSGLEKEGRMKCMKWIMAVGLMVWLVACGGGGGGATGCPTPAVFDNAECKFDTATFGP